MDLKRTHSQRTADRIIEFLRRQPRTIDEMAREIGVTRTAVRAQFASLQQLGVIEECGFRRGVSKPARLYCVTAEAERDSSRAYAPVLAELLRTMESRLPELQLEEIMRATGRGLMTGRAKPTGPLANRVESAVSVLGELGAVTEVMADGGRFIIRGYGCPLAVAAAEHRGACVALESFLATYLSAHVVARCQENGRKSCCFEVSNGA